MPVVLLGTVDEKAARYADDAAGRLLVVAVAILSPRSL